MKLPSPLVALAGIAAITTALGFAAVASGDEPFVVTDLQAPRGITSIGSQILIAEQGTGRILQVSDVGTTTVIAKGLPTIIANSPEGPLPSGPDAVIQVGSVYYFTVGEAVGEKGFDSLYSVQAGGTPTLIASFGPLEVANNYDEGFLSPGVPENVVNAYDLVWDGKNGIFVSASGANTIFHVTLDGKVTPYAIFKEKANPLFPRMGGPTMDQVPTGIAMGPDGALYVGTLTGFPFPSGGATVYRMEDLNKDGDAMDAGETTAYATGLTTVTDIAFDKDGNLLAAQFSLNMLAEAPGNVVRAKGNTSTIVGEPLISPTGITVMGDGSIIVAQEFLGIVAEIHAATEIVKSAPGGPGGGAPAPAATQTPGRIAPPSTGDGGLLD